MSTIPGYLTAQEAAGLLEVHPSQLTRYCDKHGLKFKRIGNQRLFKPADVRKFQRPQRGRPPLKESA